MGFIFKMIAFVFISWIVGLVLAKIASVAIGEEVSAIEVFQGFFEAFRVFVRWLVS